MCVEYAKQVMTGRRCTLYITAVSVENVTFQNWNIARNAVNAIAENVVHWTSVAFAEKN